MSLRANSLLSLLANRRSYYALTSKSPIPDSKISSILSRILKTVPSAFNSQTTRLVLLLHNDHRSLWDLVASTLKPKLSAEQAPKTLEKLQGFRAGYGTVLFFEDGADVQRFKEKFAMYADQFDGWSEHTSGMHQLSVWVALEAEGFGANLQHYNPVIDEGVAEKWGVPREWKLKGQMVFGMPEGDVPDAKEKKETEETLRVFGAEDGSKI